MCCPSSLLLATTVLVLVGRVLAAPIPCHNSSPSPLPVSAVNTFTCPDGVTCRTIWDIVWSCTTTIFLCTWVSFHPNVPHPAFTEWRVATVRILAVIISFLVPEMVVGTAAAEWWEARQHKFWLQGIVNSPKGHYHLTTNETTGWTQTHTYFTMMGGFIETRDGEECPLRLDCVQKLTPKTHPELLAPIFNSTSEIQPPFATPDASSYLSSPKKSSKSPSPQYHTQISEATICDKSKTKALAKLMAVAQTTWFIAQFIERWVTHQPRTQLETMTVAYAALNIVIYILWWNKPYNIDESINVSSHAYGHAQTRSIGISAPRSILEDAWNDVLGGATPSGAITGVPVLVLAGTLFGGLHCFAWRFHFPTEQEASLWRVCAIYCSVSPALFLLVHWLRRDSDDTNLRNHFISALSFGIRLTVIVYVICRLVLLALTLSCLRRLPAGVFEPTVWAKFVPHIS